jgi:hypothetical protein
MRFTSKGFGYKYNLSGSGTEVAAVYRINYLELPASLSFDLGKPDGFLFTGGVYGGVGLFGNKTNILDGEVQDRSKIKFSNSIDYNHVPIISGNSDLLIDYERNFTVKPFEFGWIAGIGYRKNQILVDLCWEQSFGSVHPYNSRLYHQSIRLGISYFI